MALLKRTITLAGLLALALAAFFLRLDESSDEQAAEPQTQETDEDKPDAFLAGAHVTEFAEDGSRSYILKSARMDRFEEEALTTLAAPTLALRTAGSPPWDVSADRGTIQRAADTGQELVELNDNVVLERLHPQTSAPMVTIRSSTLKIHPAREYAETDQDVIIDSTVGRTLAAGMKGDLQNGLLNLSSDQSQPVHTIVLPQQFKKRQETAESEG